MKTQEEQLEILFDGRQQLSYRQIAQKHGCDPRTVKKYIEHPDRIGKRRQSRPRPSLVDAYRDQIAAYLTQDPNYQASWVYDQLCKHGYPGGYELVKRVVRQIKGQRQQLAYVRFETEPAQQAQVDFGEFQAELPDGSVKRYFLFAMILGYSRRLFAVLLERCDLPSFLEAHQQALAYFGGTPHEILYDRMRNVFVRQLAGKTEFTQGLMTLATHYGFTPRAAAAYAPWVKGKIERPMDFVRESFWRGYSFSSLAQANRDLREWLCSKERRIHGTTRERIDVRFGHEKPHLLALPPAPCDVSLRLTRQVRKDCTISVDGNRYIVPHTRVGRHLTVRLKDNHLRLFDGADLIEEYDVPEGKGHLVGLDRGHYDALRADRQMRERKFGNGREHKGRARIAPTISPTVPRFPMVVEAIRTGTPNVPNLTVEHRSIDIYSRLGGAVEPCTLELAREVCHG